MSVKGLLYKIKVMFLNSSGADKINQYILCTGVNMKYCAHYKNYNCECNSITDNI